MSHNRGLKRKSNFLQAEGKTSAYARFMQELEEERQKKERLEWYLHEVMKEKEALSRFDDEASSSSSSSAAVEAFLAQSSGASTSTSTTATSSSPSATTSAGLTTYASTDYNRWVSTAQTATTSALAQSTAATSTTATTAEPAANTNNNNNNNDEECCARCGRQYLESQKTCRCRNFESVKKRQRCLSRFVRTGHMLEVSEPDELAELSVPFFDLNSFHFVEPTTTSTSTLTVDTNDNASDEDFLRMILEDVGLANEGVAPAAMTKPEPASLGEKSQRRRRASFISTSSGWDSASAVEEGNYFAPASSTGLVFGY